MKKTAYVTGADRGLGLALTQELLEQEYKVYAGSYMPDWHELKKLTEKYTDDQLKIIPLDVSDNKSVLNAAEEITADTNELNLVINNAGIAKDRSGTIYDEQYYDDILALYNVNTLGPLRVTQSILSLLLNAKDKTLVNISSIAGSVSGVTRVTQYGYTMSKTALNMQSKLIHNHLKDEGVKVLAIHPGAMKSYIFGDLSVTKNAPVTTNEAAESIVQLIHSKKTIDDSLYMDYKGETISW